MKEAWDLINDCEQESDGFQSTITLSNVEKLMIEFAKFHTEAALKNCLEKYHHASKEGYEFGSSEIMNSYNLNNIK